MKKRAALVLITILIGGFHAQAQAGERAVDGLLLGAGGGALIGQAIGRNTESTLIGTAVGSMLGFIIGSENDRYGALGVQTVYRPVQKVYLPPARRYYPGEWVRGSDKFYVQKTIIVINEGRRDRVIHKAAYWNKRGPRYGAGRINEVRQSINNHSHNYGSRQGKRFAR